MFSAYTETLMTVVIWLLDSLSLLLTATPLLMYRLLVTCERPLAQAARTKLGGHPRCGQQPARSEGCIFL